MIRTFFFTCILVLWASVEGRAQDPVHMVLDTYKGLPSNTVYDILQDVKGYIWLAHDKGLSRYDGVHIKNYKQNNVQSKAVSNLMLDQNDIVYCQDFTGNFYNVKEDSLLIEKNIPSFGNYGLSSISSNNEIIIPNLNSGLRIYNLQTKKLTEYNYRDAFLYYAEKDIGYLAGDSIYIFNAEKKFVNAGANYNNFGYVAKRYDGRFIYFPQNTDKPIITSGKNGWDAFYSLPRGYFILGTVYIQDEIWVYTTTGTFVLDKKLNLKNNGFCFFKNSSISKILLDREGNYWFSTLNKGVLFVPNLNSRMYAYNDLAIKSLAYDDANNYLLAGTSRSDLLAFKNKTQGFSLIFKANQPHDINHIFVDNENKNVFLSAFSLTNTNTKSTNGIPIAGVKNIAKISKDVYAYAQSSSYGFYYPYSNTAPGWLMNLSNKSAFTNARTINKTGMRCRWVDFDTSTQNLYAVTSLGIFYHNANENGKLLWNQNEIYATSLLAKEGTVYIATFNQGVLIAKNNIVIQQLHSGNGLLQNTVNKIFIQDGKYWLLFENGIQVYDPVNGGFTTFKKDYGLPAAELKDILVKDSTVYIATDKGLVSFKVSAGMLKQESKIYLDKIIVNNKIFYNQNGLKLQPDENNIVINFSVLNFAIEEDIAIFYRINNGAWLLLEKGVRSINLNALSAGKYHIQIKPQSERFSNPKNILDIQFSIRAKFYQTWWFRTLCAIILLFAIWTYYQKRLRQQKAKSRLSEEKLLLEQELQKSRLSSIKSQMNPHFIFNALNTIQSYIYTNDKENASVYLGKFSTLTRLILDMSNREKVTLSEEIKALELYLELEKQRFESGMVYEIFVDPAIDLEFTKIPSMLIQPYVENAVKHGLLHKKGQGKVSISFTKMPDGLIRVKIEDDGVGRKKSAAINNTKAKIHESFAVAANKTRLELLNKERKNQISLIITDKHNEQGEPTGTIVELFF